MPIYLRLCSSHTQHIPHILSRSQFKKSNVVPIVHCLKFANRFRWLQSKPNHEQHSRNSGRNSDNLKVAKGAIFFLGCFGIYSLKKMDQTNRQKFNFIADVVDQCAPAVVNIDIVDKRRIDLETGGPVIESNGSGFIVEPDGLILTNAHVVMRKPHTSVRVQLHDGRSFDAKIEDVDDKSDLATIRIACSNLPTLRLGTSNDLRVGEFVAALGSPLSLNNTVTQGVVSSLHRPSKQIGRDDENINHIQTDAAITVGNSGGPLINLDGEAIGINRLHLSAGISFAIPIDYVLEFLSKSRTARTKKIGPQLPRRYMGITMVSITKEICTALRDRELHNVIPINVDKGVMVWKVIIGSPAYRADLRPFDIIQSINGKKIEDTADVYVHLSGEEDTLKLVVRRGNKNVTLSVCPVQSDET